MVYEVLTKFRVGDLVRIDHELTYFDPSVLGVPMEVLRVERITVDGKEAVRYYTDRLDPILQTPYNENELIGVNNPLPIPTKKEKAKENARKEKILGMDNV